MIRQRIINQETCNIDLKELQKLTKPRNQKNSFQRSHNKACKPNSREKNK